MKPPRLPRSSICILCRGLSANVRVLPRCLVKPQSPLRTITTSHRLRFPQPPQPQAASQPHRSEPPPRESLAAIKDLEVEIKTALFSSPSATKSLEVPSEADVLAAIERLSDFAKTQIHSLSTEKISPEKKSPTSALLSLEEKSSVKEPVGAKKALTDLTAPGPRIAVGYSPYPAQTTRTFQAVADLAFEVLFHENVFITQKILAAYVDLCCVLRNPTNIPAAFALYAKKPVYDPRRKTTWSPNPNQAKYAIPNSIALKALDAAIESKNMVLCLDIIDTSYGAPAFRRSKLIRKALPTVMVGVLTPPAMWVLADALAGYQDEVDHAVAAKYAFGGLLAYLAFTSSIGMTALMTSNDQMVRVTWVVGTPLRERWLREEERAAYDRVAMAWGFEEVNRRGFEEGEEWELLREVVARKGMILDNPALMDGME
ncbi:hypothetical protein RUND412_008703 [Rhizina undulata]